jgi:hypothetical protein
MSPRPPTSWPVWVRRPPPAPRSDPSPRRRPGMPSVAIEKRTTRPASFADFTSLLILPQPRPPGQLFVRQSDRLLLATVLALDDRRRPNCAQSLALNSFVHEGISEARPTDEPPPGLHHPCLA